MSRILLALVLLLGPVAGAAERAPAQAAYALVIGSNYSVDESLPHLDYADDDAALYYEMFTSLGIDTIILSRFDSDTVRLHGDSARVALPPTKRGLAIAVAAIQTWVSRAKAMGTRTSLYFVFAGHGNSSMGENYLTLEDYRLDARTIKTKVLDRIGASVNHVVVDSCFSSSVVIGRGPGGSRRPWAPFAKGTALLADESVGLLVSRSPSQRVHESDVLQAGVFSHELRSGMLGAADADLDGRVTYKELVAFVTRANEAIPNPKFRFQVVARPPETDTDATLVDFAQARAGTLEVDGAHHGRYYIEDHLGVRLVDFHSGAGQAVRIRLPRDRAPFFVRPVGGGREYVIQDASGTVELSALGPSVPSLSARGADTLALSRLFELPFDLAYVRDMPGLTSTTRMGVGGASLTGTLGWAMIGAAALSSAIGGAMIYSAWRTKANVPPGASHREVVEANGVIEDHDRKGAMFLAVGVVSSLAGTLLLSLDDEVAPAGPPGTVGLFVRF